MGKAGVEFSQTLFVTLKRGLAGKRFDQRATVAALGLRKRESTVELPNNASVRGMLDKVRHDTVDHALVKRCRCSMVY